MKGSHLVAAVVSALVLVVSAAEPASAQRRANPGRSGGAVGGGPVVGRAVPRPPVSGPVGRPGVGSYRPYYPYYPYYPAYPYYRYGYPYRYGYGYGYPYGFGVGFNFSFGSYPYFGVYPYAYGGGYPYSYPYYYAPYGYFGFGFPSIVTYGQVSIRGAARDAQVFVDGSYAGVVDDFDGTFQRLNLVPGTHQIEIRRPNAAPQSFDVRIDPGRTITYHAPSEP
jgi:hypothetical protein